MLSSLIFNCFLSLLLLAFSFIVHLPQQISLRFVLPNLLLNLLLCGFLHMLIFDLLSQYFVLPFDLPFLILKVFVPAATVFSYRMHSICPFDGSATFSVHNTTDMFHQTFNFVVYGIKLNSNLFAIVFLLQFLLYDMFMFMLVTTKVAFSVLYLVKSFAMMVVVILYTFSVQFINDNRARVGVVELHSFSYIFYLRGKDED